MEWVSEGGRVIKGWDSDWVSDWMWVRMS
jgi:hypothetical protein